MTFRKRRVFVLLIAVTCLYFLWRILADQATLVKSIRGPEKPVVPKVQYNFASRNRQSDLRKSRKNAVKAAFKYSWDGYKEKAWLKDELGPVYGGYRTTFSGWGATLIDSLDTLWIMGMKDEFEEAVLALKEVDFKTPAGLPINVFETTIRYLGGLLGAYDVSGGQYPLLLQKATEVGEMLYPAFNTPNKMPVTRWFKIPVEVAAGDTITAELASLSLEFTRLSQLTGDPKYFEAIIRITDCIHSQQMRTKVPGLLPHSVNARECDFTQDITFSLGGYVDSAYEYMAKMHQFLSSCKAGSKSAVLPLYQIMYERATKAIQENLLFRPMTPDHDNILFAGTMKVYKPTQIETSPQMQHLACFAGGMFALGAKLFNTPSDLTIARMLTDGCIWAYNATVSGVMPEIFNAVPCPNSESNPNCVWDETLWSTEMRRLNSHDEQESDKLLADADRSKMKSLRLRLPPGISAIASREYNLRPEAIESIFVLYRITGDITLLEAGWKMFESIVLATKTDLAFSAIDDVTVPIDQARKRDKMESFWMAETLKYFYLLFDEEDVVSLDDFVFNTEAHPLKLGG